MIDETIVQGDQIVAEVTPESNHLATTKPERDEITELKELNFRHMRESTERERRRAEAAERELEEYRRINQARASEPDELDSDDLADKRQLKKLRDEWRKEVERRDKKDQERQEEFAQIKAQSIQFELAAEFPDYKATVNDRMLEALKAKDPDAFDSIMMLSKMDTRKALLMAYKTIKATVNTKSYDAHDQRLAENKIKPRAAASVPAQDSTTPLSTFREDGRWKLSASEAKALREDTARCARNR